MKIFSFISNIIAVYTVVLWVRVLLTWLPSQRDPYHADGPFVTFLKNISDPFLNLFKSKSKRGMIDLSALWAFMSLNFLQSVFIILGRTGTITLETIIILVLQGIWQYFLSLVLILLCVALLLRYICGKRPANPRCAAFLSNIDPIIRKPVNFVAAILEFVFKKKRFTDQAFVLASLVFYVLLYFAVRQGFAYLLNMIMSTVRAV